MDYWKEHNTDVHTGTGGVCATYRLTTPSGTLVIIMISFRTFGESQMIFGILRK